MTSFEANQEAAHMTPEKSRNSGLDLDVAIIGTGEHWRYKALDRAKKMLLKSVL